MKKELIDDQIMTKFFRFPKSIRVIITTLYYEKKENDGWKELSQFEIEIIHVVDIMKGETDDFPSKYPDRIRADFCKFLRRYDVFNKEV